MVVCGYVWLCVSIHVLVLVIVAVDVMIVVAVVFSFVFVVAVCFVTVLIIPFWPPCGCHGCCIWNVTVSVAVVAVLALEVACGLSDCCCKSLQFMLIFPCRMLECLAPLPFFFRIGLTFFFHRRHAMINSNHFNNSFKSLFKPFPQTGTKKRSVIKTMSNTLDGLKFKLCEPKRVEWIIPRTKNCLISIRAFGTGALRTRELWNPGIFPGIFPAVGVHNWTNLVWFANHRTFGWINYDIHVFLATYGFLNCGAMWKIKKCWVDARRWPGLHWKPCYSKERSKCRSVCPTVHHETWKKNICITPNIVMFCLCLMKLEITCCEPSNFTKLPSFLFVNAFGQ